MTNPARNISSFKALTGRAREVKPFLWITAFLFLIVFAKPAIDRLITGP